MQRVLVVDKHKKPLMPCSPARARELLKKGRAKVYRRFPFTIIIVDREGGETQEIQFKVDPGAKTSGLVLVAAFNRGLCCIWAAELTHRGLQIRDALLSRRQIRRGRRQRKTRYRQARFENRRRVKGWLPPSLQSRIDNSLTWLKRLCYVVPISHLAQELVRFDTQALQNPEISGVEYQQGTLMGYEVREYLLEKWGRKCAYCGASDKALQIEHIVPKSRGGSNRVSNLTIACARCNQDKGTKTAAEFGYPQIQAQAKKPLRDAAAINATRRALFERLKQTGLPLELGTGSRTKFNRIQQGYPKSHWLDAVCVGESGKQVFVSDNLQPLQIKAIGHGSRQMCRMDRFGFPRTKPKQFKRVNGFQTGDIVQVVITAGQKIGTYVGRVAVRATGNFNISTSTGTIQGISWKYCQLLQGADGYAYSFISAMD
jgi:5-methylcytosine-specific restriction endonuclease McrA